MNPKTLASLSMAAFHQLLSPLLHLNHQYSHFIITPNCLLSTKKPQKSNPIRASINGDQTSSPEPPKPARRGRKKISTNDTATPTTKGPKRTRKSETSDGSIELSIAKEIENFNDEIDFPYEDPPLVCCFGAARKEFLPTVRVSNEQMHPDIYADWKMLQWDPPEFARAPGGPSSNVAISHVRLGGRAALMGKIGGDEFGQEILLMLNKEKVQTRALKIEDNVRTGCSHMKIKFDDNGKILVEKVKDAPEDSFISSELNISVLKEAKILHYNSDALISSSMNLALLKAIAFSKKFGNMTFFDLNLPLPLWKSRDQTHEIIKKAWESADIIEVTKQELEFLLDEDHYERKRNYRPQYFAESYEQSKNRRDYYHYTPEEISPLWHENIKLLFVTDGTLRIHFYTPEFDGVVIGTEDVLITPYTCDRTGSGDTIVAAIMRKLTIQPEMFKDKDVLERELRFAVAAGIISQWTIGAVRGFPTESAAQNLKEQVYVPSMW